MVRFASAEENGFKRLLGVLARWTEQVALLPDEGLPGTSPSSATVEGDRGATSVNTYGPSTQNINSITTGSGPTNVGQHQTINQTFGRQQ
jgi:hypothetical protein